jgi:hypothetical protein
MSTPEFITGETENNHIEPHPLKPARPPEDSSTRPGSRTGVDCGGVNTDLLWFFHLRPLCLIHSGRAENPETGPSRTEIFVA